MDLFNKLTAVDDDTYFTKEYQAIIETHLLFLNNERFIEIKQIAPYLSLKYKGDFYGLLLELKLERLSHYATLRVNGLTSPLNYNGDENFIRTVRPGILVSLVNLTKTEFR